MIPRTRWGSCNCESADLGENRFQAKSEKMARKRILASPGNKKKWPRNRKNRTKMGFWAILGRFFLSSSFIPIFPVRPNPFSGLLFPISGRKPEIDFLPGRQTRKAINVERLLFRLAILNRSSATLLKLRSDLLLCLSLRKFWRFQARNFGIVQFAIRDSVPLRHGPHRLQMRQSQPCQRSRWGEKCRFGSHLIPERP